MEIKMDIRDTSKDYDDLVGFKAKENILVNLSEFIGEQIEDKPNIFGFTPSDYCKISKTYYHFIYFLGIEWQCTNFSKGENYRRCKKYYKQSKYSNERFYSR